MLYRVQYSTRLENDPYRTGGGPKADYAFMLIFGGFILCCIGLFMNFAFLGPSMVFMIVYCWSRREPEAPVSIWGFKMQGLYLPWALMALQVLMGGSPVMDLVGVVAGHVYYFLVEVLPIQQGQPSLLTTPKWVTNWLPSQQVAFTTTSGPVERTTTAKPTPARHTWGSGSTLGSTK